MEKYKTLFYKIRRGLIKIHSILQKVMPALDMIIRFCDYVDDMNSKTA